LLPAVSPLLADPGNFFLDFSHSKPVGEAVRHLSIIWHDPHIMQPPQPKTGVVALSQWQARRFREVYHQECKVLDPICGDGDYFVPGGAHDGLGGFNDRGSGGDVVGASAGIAGNSDYLLFIGKLSPDKGCLEAIQACQALKQRLEIIGPVTPGDPPEYVGEVLSQCDGQDIIYHGEVTEPHKLALMQGAKALLYPVSYPPGFGEAHSHKAAEAMLCGLPCIAYDQGAMAEVIDQGVTGLVIPGREQLGEAIRTCENLDRKACRVRAVERFDYRQVVGHWLPPMAYAATGATW